MDQKLVRAEKTEGRSLAVVYDGGDLGKELLGKLRQKSLKVIFVDLESGLPALEKPNYIIFFASDRLGSERLRQDWREALVTAKRNEAKLVLCLDNLPVGIAKRMVDQAEEEKEKISEIEIKGAFLNKADREGAAEKIVRVIFGSGLPGKTLLVGEKETVFEPRHYTTNVTTRLPKEEWVPTTFSKNRSKAYLSRWVGVVSFLIILFFTPLLLSSILASWGAVHLLSGEKLLASGRFTQAKQEADLASEKFGWGMAVAGRWTTVANLVGLGKPANNYYDLLLAGKSVAEALNHGTIVVEGANSIIAMVLGNGPEVDLETEISKIKPELAAIDQDLGFITASWPQISGFGATFAPWFGVPSEKLADAPKKLTDLSGLISDANRFLDILPEITGAQAATKKSYLVILQNSSELRPTGGFIGSYAIVNFDSGRLLDFKINDIYSADGQLRGRIQPPDEILHFLGQPSWYMRDANWAADFPLTARRLEWFLEKETGQKVAGVWAVGLPAIQKLLTATGPLELPDLNETVSAADFYYKAEYSSEINFFPGSTQKRDFLGAAATALTNKLTTSTNRDWLALGQSLAQALTQKDVLLYFDNEKTQKQIEALNWAGEITKNDCVTRGSNCLMLVEANLGANKANFFLSRGILVNTLIGKAGEIENRITIRYQNNSPSVSWPGGTYKNYIRFLVPPDAELTGFDLGDGRRPKISDVLTADVLSAVPTDQFFVYKNMELSGQSKGASDSALLSFGTFFQVPVGESRTITFSYRPAYRLNFGNSEPELKFTFLRQSGTGTDQWDFLVDYPQFLTLQLAKSNIESEKTLVLPQKLNYNTDLSRDRQIKIIFSRD